MVSDGQAHSILIVDDEPYITDLVKTAFELEEFDVAVASRGFEAMRFIKEMKPDLVVLDVMLPDISGVEVTRRLRDQENTIPVVFLTAKDEPEDKLTGLGLGDDYICKPFSVDELIARVKAVLRRSVPLESENPAVLSFAGLSIDTRAREVSRDGSMVDLTATEFNLLVYLMENARLVVSKAEILESVWGPDFSGDPGIVETYISYLRKKVDYCEPFLIQTVRGVGYCLRLPRD